MQKNISIIVAVSENNAIGKAGQIPWHLPRDFAYFKQQTLGKTVVMGRKTYESIGKPLPQRENIICTRNVDFVAAGVKIVSSLVEAFKIAKFPVFVCGGAGIYEEAMVITDTIYLTRVVVKVANPDTFFPVLAEQTWELVANKFVAKDENNEYDLYFCEYRRRKNT